MTERIAWLIDPDESGLRHVSYRDCGHCREFAQGCVCDVHGAAGWYATDPNGFCHRAVRREG